MITAHSPNIAVHLAEMAARQPNTDALLSDVRRDARGKLSYTHTTFKQLNDRADALVRGFASLGIASGMRAALVVKPGVDLFAVTFALFRMGAIPVLIDPGIGIKNFGRCLEQARPEIFIGIPLAHLFRRLLGWSKRTIHTNITTGAFGGYALQKLALPPNKRQSAIGSGHSSDAAILFTSGSTGPAKGVLYTHENFNAQIAALKQIYNLQPGEIDLATFPLFALFGPALGMTTVLPDMNFTRPGFVHPPNIIDPIQQLGITNMFGSPALIDRVGRYGEQNNIKLPSLRRVISAGVPASAPSLERFSKLVDAETQIFTPYGATESLPVASIGSHEILGETRKLTDEGHGVCVGLPAPNITVRIIKITDTPILQWSDDLELPQGQIGEITVQGPAVTAEYFQRPDATTLAKIPIPNPLPLTPNPFYHRMGDCGYFDDKGRLWFVGRKSQRVRLPQGDLFSIPVEAIFNTHDSVARSALVGVMRNGAVVPVVCIEIARVEPGNGVKYRVKPLSLVTTELLALAQKHPGTRSIKHFLFHPRFPVDIRHNAKINREQLSQWAQKRLT